MRNLKRVLSLALAAIMLMGMMIVGASAVDVSDFTDADQITNQEAAAITTAIKLFSGYGDGTFRPGNIVTRAEMATIICKMLYGADVNASNMSGVNIFKDVTETWQVGYVNLCNSLKIVTGYGDGTFKPDQTVTTAEAALMICKALGYFQNNAEYGDNWELAAISKATQLGLMGNLRLSANAGLTRDSVSVMAFNALAYALPVEYNATFNNYHMVGGSILNGVPTGADVARYNQYTLGYMHFDLVGQFDNDEYGRPGQQWGFGEYRIANNGDILQTIMREDITFTANEPVVTYTRKMTGPAASTVARDLKNYSFSTTYSGNDGSPITVNAPVTTDGKSTGTAANADAIAALTGNGVIVEVYAGAGTQDAKRITEVVVIRPQVATVTAVNARSKTVSLRLNRGTDGTHAVNYTVGESSPFYAVASGAQAGDILLAVYGGTDDKTLMDLWIPESVTGTITEINVTAANADKIGGIDGVRYTGSSRWYTDKEHQFDNSTQINSTATIYLDRNNYVMYVAPATINAVSNYLYVTNVWQTKEIVRGIPTPTNYVRGVNTDGEIVTLKIANNIFAVSGDDVVRIAENAMPTDGTVVDSRNFPNVQYGYAQAPGKAYVFDNRAYSSATNSATGSATGRGVDGKYSQVAYTVAAATLTSAWTAGTNSKNIVTSDEGFIAEYQQGKVDPDLYLLKVPAVGSANSAGVMAEQSSGLQSYERVISNVYMATDVNFIATNYDATRDSLRASAQTGVQYVKTSQKFVPVVTEDSAGHRLITAVYVLNGTSYTTDLYYVSGKASYRVGYTDASGRPATGYNNGLYRAGDEVDKVAVKTNDEVGFYQMTGMDGGAYVIEQYTEANQAVERPIMDAYNRSILVDNEWYDVADAVWSDLTKQGIDSIESIRALMETGSKLLASFTYGGSNEKKVPCLYLTSERDMPGRAIGVAKNMAANDTVAAVEFGDLPVAEDTVFVLHGNVRTGVPNNASGQNIFGIRANTTKNGRKLFVVGVNLPGTNNNQPYALRITSAANDPHNWNSYPWPSDATLDENGVKRVIHPASTTGLVGGDAQSLGVLSFAGDVITVEVMLNCGAGFTWGTNDANFVASYTITIDTTGVTLVGT